VTIVPRCMIRTPEVLAPGRAMSTRVTAWATQVIKNGSRISVASCQARTQFDVELPPDRERVSDPSLPPPTHHTTCYTQKPLGSYTRLVGSRSCCRLYRPSCTYGVPAQRGESAA